MEQNIVLQNPIFFSTFIFRSIHPHDLKMFEFNSFATGDVMLGYWSGLFMPFIARYA